MVAHKRMWTCDVIWDGTDFSQCARDKYLSNISVVVIIVSALMIVSSRLYSYSKKKGSVLKAKISPSDLISPAVDLNLAKLESDVILSSLAANLLPPHVDSVVPEEAVHTSEAGRIIDDYKERPLDVKRWTRVRQGVLVGGSAVWLGVEIGRAILEGGWKSVAFPGFVFVLAFVPHTPVEILLTIHIIPALLLFRSAIIQPHTSMLALAPTIVEIVYWSALISIPYGEGLSRLLAGSVSKGGGSASSYGEELPKHVEEPTSIFGRATYSFMLPLLFKHYWKPIQLHDIPAIREDDGSAASIGAFRAYQARRDKAYAEKHNGDKRKRDLGLDLLRFFSPEISVQAIWATIFICLQYLPPTGLRLLLQYIGNRGTADEQPSHVAWLYVAMMAIGQVVGVVAMGQSLFIGRRLCIRLRATMIAEVFAKALRRQDLAGNVKKTSTDQDGKPIVDNDTAASEGKIANLVSVDAFQVSEICGYIFYLWSCPFAVVINSILLYNTLGLASFAGIAVLVLLMPVQALIGRMYTIIQRKFMAATDARLESVTELLQSVKLVKFNAWESKFLERMAITRKHELSILAQRFATTVLFNLVIWGTPVLVTASAFAVHSLVLKQPLTADRAFSSLILFNMLRDPMALFQDTLTRLLQSYTSCTRVQAFLDEPDTLKYRQLTHPGHADPAVGFDDAIVGYSSHEEIQEAEYEPFRLGPLNLSFPVGQLSVIAGPVGCGKTTLITSLLGETTLLAGKIFMPDDRANRDVCPIDPATGLADTVAYCAQTPWLVGASIRENIVFGSRWDKHRYDAVVNACALRRDFEIFDLGDETEVGEKGTTCSGGQKARIALARAIYSPAKTVILDDVLSAVDAQTAKHLHTRVLLGPLMRDRTCILVSHAINLVASSAAYVVMLDAGAVTASGSPAELSASGALDLADEESDSGSGKGDLIDHSEPVDAVLGVDSESTVTSQHMMEDDLQGIEADQLETAKPVTTDISVEPKVSKQLVQAESQEQGSVGFGTYILYFKAQGGIIYWMIVLLAFAGSQILQVGTNNWIKDWANSNDRKAAIVAWASKERSTQFYLGVYCAIAGLYLIAVALRVGTNFYGSLCASRGLWDRLLKRILGAKMRFFDSTPSGRIMNRLSKDISSVDTEAAEILQYFAQCVLSVVAVLVVVVFSTPTFILALIVISILYWIVGALYVETSREIKRIDSVTRSPIFISFSEVLVGMSTIRSYGDSARFMRKLFHELDQNTRCFWYLWQANRVLNNWSNFVGSLVTIFACIFALRNPSMDAGAVGFSITYALSFTEYVLWVVRLYAASQMSMNSIERVSEYLELEVEEEDHARGVEPPAYWPSRDGSVVVENLTCRYAPQLDPVLRNVSFTIAPKEKIGICGRTGSGKSTLALSFFRFLHQESGSIIIDGLDISKLSLSTLRSRLTILPQEAQLFSGTIRDNLDPFNQHEDAEIWEALRQVRLSGKTPSASRAGSRYASTVDLKAQSAKAGDTKKHSLKNLQAEAFKPTPTAEELDDDEDEIVERVMIRSLDEKVAVGGKNFSQGQRQLLALARGLLKLRSSNFLIMDESTANLDHATDMTIQNVLRTSLGDTQMLVIAHRLLTVAGLDKILVLDHGKVVEFGTPWELLQNDQGVFRDLTRQSGEESQLFEMARLVHEKKAARTAS